MSSQTQKLQLHTLQNDVPRIPSHPQSMNQSFNFAALHQPHQSRLSQDFLGSLKYANNAIMFSRAITNASRNALPPLTPLFSSARLLPRVAATSRCAHPRLSPPSRSITSSNPACKSPLRSRILLFRGFPRTTATPRSLKRPFSSSVRRSYGFGNQSYRRFNGPGRQSAILRLLSNAKPHHFVIIGLVISGGYIYNSETVEVSWLSIP